MEGIRSGLFRGGVRGRPRGSTPRLDGVEVDAAFEGLVVTGGPNFTSSEKPSWHSSRTSLSGSSRSTARALEISDRQRSSATLDGLGRPAKVRRTSVTSATGIPPRSDSRNDGRVAVHTFVEINSVASMAWRSTRRNFDFHTGPDDHVPVQAHQPILGPASPPVLAHLEAVREHHQKLVEEPALGAPHVHDRRRRPPPYWRASAARVRRRPHRGGDEESARRRRGRRRRGRGSAPRGKIISSPRGGGGRRRAGFDGPRALARRRARRRLRPIVPARNGRRLVRGWTRDVRQRRRELIAG